MSERSFSQLSSDRVSDTVLLEGRVLYLYDDVELMERQLKGEEVGFFPQKLRDDISTDEIAPGYVCYHFDEKLGEFPYVGFKAEGKFPIQKGDIKRGGFQVSVSGKRRGKGSSREQAPFAEKCAGIRLILAENIERIYKQNCQNLGLLVSTDFSLLEDLAQRRPISLERFLENEDEISRKIVEYGGLFPFNLARLAGKVSLSSPCTSARAMTLTEKIIARHWIGAGGGGVPFVRPGDAGFVEVDLRFSHEYVTPMAATLYERWIGEGVRDPDSIVFFRDHLTFLEEVMPPERVQAGFLDLAERLKRKQEEFAKLQGIRVFGEAEDGGSVAICHSKVCEDFALPGQIIIGSDSHTPHSGALGALAFGVGTTEIANSWFTKDVRICVPPSIKICFVGRMSSSLSAKDLMLEALRHPYIKNGHAIGKMIEYSGEVVEQLSVDERATLTNMAAEVGGFSGIVAPDEEVVRFLVERRGLPLAAARVMVQGLFSDPEAEYEEVIEIDVSSLKPMVALPGDPGNGVFIEELGERVPVDIAYGGSCTGGKCEDMDYYARVLKKALESGRKVHSRVSFWIQFGSKAVKDYAERRGYLEIFRQAGVRLIEPSCGACINAGPGVSSSSDQVTISAINRNFPGRSGPGKVYLASPLTVAASAVAGYITDVEGLFG
ncbi:MAG: 3-isopropylmalate dehydratase [Planctomycetota bacterium]|nr:MAG: 3-isopropylmalate dehydratase [Planctomycetota bacterium]